MSKCINVATGSASVYESIVRTQSPGSPCKASSPRTGWSGPTNSAPVYSPASSNNSSREPPAPMKSSRPCLSPLVPEGMSTTLGIGTPFVEELAQPFQSLEYVRVGLSIGVERHVHPVAVELDVLPFGELHPALAPAPDPGERDGGVPLTYGGVYLAGPFGDYQGLVWIPQPLAQDWVRVQDLPVTGARLVLNGFTV